MCVWEHSVIRAKVLQVFIRAEQITVSRHNCSDSVQSTDVGLVDVEFVAI